MYMRCILNLYKFFFNYIIIRLECVRSRRCLHRYPKRIILVRHAQVSLQYYKYYSLPDSYLI